MSLEGENIFLKNEMSLVQPNSYSLKIPCLSALARTFQWAFFWDIWQDLIIYSV